MTRNMLGSYGLMAIGQILLCYILVLCFNKPFGYGATAVERSKSRTVPSMCSGPEKGLRVVHKYGPCSPFGLSRTAETSRQILVQDEARVKAMNSRLHKKRTGGGTKKVEGEAATDLYLLDDSVGAGYYLVQVGFGTPAKYFKLTLDTGSYITWVRCQRCEGSSCQTQHDESYYDPSSSSTSSNAPCFPWCDFNQSYMDNSISVGFFMADTVSIEQDDKIPEFVFLCATKEAGDFGKADGILGLSLGDPSHFGDYSLTSQTATTFGNVFCHCLPNSDNSMGYVYFGEKALDKCRSFSGTYTPLVTGSDPSFYFVNLIAITIGQTRVEISSDGSSSQEALIDSGTVITRLPSSVYSALRSEFQALMSEYPTALPDKVLDTCYNLEGYDDPEIPMVLHFDNLDSSLGQAAVTWKGSDSKSQVCFAFAEKKNEGDFTIIGNHQQQNLNILYNIPDQKVEIGPGSC